MYNSNQCIFVVCLLFTFLSAAAQQKNDKELNVLLDKYVLSINTADSVLAKTFWSSGKEVSFLNPRGNEYGWNGVRNIYAMFGGAFTKRNLRYMEPRWTDYGRTAWVEFSWVFDAVFTSNNQPMQTKGRETQIWKKERVGWKLVHIHYSGMPVTGERQGF